MNRHVINNEIRNLVLTTGNFHSDFLEDFVSRIDKKIKLILSQFHSYIKEAIAKSSREIYEFNFNAGIVAHEEGFETIRKIVEKILDIRLQVEKNSGNYGYNTICETIFANHPVFYYQYKALWSPNNIYFYSYS